MLGGRSPRFVLREATDAANWRALAAMRRRYPAFLENARRYFTGAGDYPYAPEVRTPAGVVAPTLYSHHDLLTVNEVFCREDYRAEPGWRTVVDVGANIGISALYFLTEAPGAHVVCFEPVPQNVARLRENLAGFEDRYEVREVALSDRTGTARFGVDPFGRYGGFLRAGLEQIEVATIEIGEALDGVLAEADRIDLLKIDTEGTERELLAAIPAATLARIDEICFEDERAGAFAPPPGFSARRVAGTRRLSRVG